MKMARVFVSGSFDPPHSGHIAFFETAARYGDLYVGIGSNDSITAYKHPVFMSEDERLYIIKAIRHVNDANINPGMGSTDFLDNPFFRDADILIVNEDQNTFKKKLLCLMLGIIYIILPREPALGLPRRSSSQFRNQQ